MIFFSVLPFRVVNMRICLDRKTFENNACVGQGDIPVFLLLSVGIGPLSWADMFILIGQQQQQKGTYK